MTQNCFTSVTSLSSNEGSYLDVDDYLHLKSKITRIYILEVGK